MINSKNKKRKNVIKAKERNNEKKKEYIKIQSNLLIFNVPFSLFL